MDSATALEIALFESARFIQLLAFEFEAQIVDNLMPLSYDLTRTRGRIEFIAQMSMDERITVMNEAPTKQLTFADLQSLPPSKNRGIIPKNPLK